MSLRGLDGPYKPSAIDTALAVRNPPLGLLYSVNMKGFQIKGNAKTLKLSPSSAGYRYYGRVNMEPNFVISLQQIGAAARIGTDAPQKK